MPAALAGERQDRALAALLPEHSRARLTAWIREGRVTVDGQRLPPKTRMAEGMALTVTPGESPSQVARVEPQAMALDILYEDDEILVINKPAGLTVHPGAGQADGTLQNALLAHRASLARVPRAGIVHRLDKHTSGVLVVAATETAQTALVRAIQAREIGREYRALVWGVPVAGGRIEAALGRHPRDRTRFAVVRRGRDAVTHYRVLEKFERHALLGLALETGRTHQIRVHLQHAGYPIIGDPAYGRRGDPWRRSLGRQALHAYRLSLAHPASGEALSWEVPLPADLQAVLDAWRDAAVD